MKPMPAKYKGKCGRCGAATSVGMMIYWDGLSKKVVCCPNCEARGIPEEGPKVVFSANLCRQAAGEVFRELNPEQQAAVIGSASGYCEWLATAGAGKTKAIIALVGQLLSRGTRPSRILLASFTKKAAVELRDRLITAYGPIAGEITTGTFHALCRKWLTMYAKLDASYARVDNLLDFGGLGGDAAGAKIDEEPDDAKPRSPTKLAQTLLCNESLSIPWLPGRRGLFKKGNATRAVAEDYAEAVGYLEGWLTEPGSPGVEAYAKGRGLPLLPEFYKNWVDSLTALQTSTYDEWLYLVGKLTQVPGGLFTQRIAGLYDAVIIDEAQDNNIAQLQIAAALAQLGQRHLVLVGDLAQSIYGFRAAMPRIMQELGQLVNAPVKVFFLQRNHRSLKPIVDLGNGLIEGRKWAVAPPAVSVRGDAPDVLRCNQFVTERDAAAAAVDLARVRIAKAPPNRGSTPIALLARCHARLALAEAELIRERIPYQVQEGRGFFNIWEVRVAMAYMLLANDLGRSAAYIKDALSAPRRHLGNGFAKVLEQTKEASTVMAVRILARRNSSWEKNAMQFAADLDTIGRHEEIRDQGLALLELLTKVEAFGKGAATQDRMDNVESLLAVAESFKTMAEFATFCEKAVAHKSASEDMARVVLSTIHGAKGLEWPCVVLLACNDDVMPHSKSMGKEELEEERRAEYVGVTRARDQLVLSRYRFNAREQGTTPSWSYVLAAQQLGLMTEDFASEYDDLQIDVTRAINREAKRKAAELEAEQLRAEAAEEARRQAHAETTPNIELGVDEPAPAEGASAP